jgi:hypothetical protein
VFIKRFSTLAMVCAMGFVSVCSFAQESRPAKGEDQKQQILKVEQEIVNAEINSDQVALQRLLTDQYTHTHVTGIQESKAVFIDGFKTGRRKYKSMDIKDTNVVLTSDTTAIVTGHVWMNNAFNPPPPDRGPDSFLEVMVRDHGNWRRAAWAQTRPPAPAPAAPAPASPVNK